MLKATTKKKTKNCYSLRQVLLYAQSNNSKEDQTLFKLKTGFTVFTTICLKQPLKRRPKIVIA